MSKILHQRQPPGKHISYRYIMLNGCGRKQFERLKYNQTQEEHQIVNSLFFSC